MRAGRGAGVTVTLQEVAGARADACAQLLDLGGDLRRGARRRALRQQGGGHVGAHPGQGVGAHRLDPRLFDGVEHLGRLGVRRPHPAVHRRIVIGQT